MRFDILTLFPSLILPYFKDSILKRAVQKKKIRLYVHNIRDYSKDKHKKTDDTPYGGGAGMVMTCQVLFDAIKAVKKKNKGPVIFLTPRGKRYTQKVAEKLAQEKELVIVCGRYEGFDQRAIDALADEEISIGDFVLTGGELAALMIVDSISRLIPGVVGAEESIHEESFSPKLDRMLEYPHYTKPAVYKNLKVPSVLLSGNHGKIKAWRLGHRRKSSL